MLRVLCVCLFCALIGCKPNEDSRVKAIIGAVLIDGNGGPPITDSVVVVSGSRIRSAGLRANVPIPAGSDKINGSGKFLTPGLIDLYATAGGDAWIYTGVTATRQFSSEREFTGELTDPEAARRKVADLSARHADFLFVRADDARLNPVVTDTILEEARKFNIPVTAGIATLAQTQQLVKSGAAGFVRMIGDTEDIDQAFLAQLRSLNVVVVPVLTLTKSPITMRNTKRMAVAGVPIGVGSGGASPGTLREMELLAEAGLSPLEVTAAATRTGALAMRRLSEIGTIEAGKRADLLLLNANPLEDVRNFGKIDQMMLEGEWVDRASLKVK